MPGIAERLQQARRQQLVGRDDELARFQRIVEASELPCAVLSVFGPGGVGKTALVWAFADACEARGIPCRALEGRLLEATPEALRAALDGVGQSGGREVVLLDGFDAVAPLEGWLREVYLPEHTGDTLFVLVGRRPLSATWRTDAAWQELLQSMPLRNLPPDAARSYLEARGLSGEALEAAIGFTHGYPLALALVADLHQQRGRLPTSAEPPPDVVQALLERFVEGTPTPEHRAALEVCALLRVTTEPVLARILGRDEAHLLFEWLHSLSFIEPGQPGVYPQEVAREALLADLRWRSPDRYAELHRKARDVYKEGLATGSETEQLRVLWDYTFLHRDNPIIRQAFTWQDTFSAYPDATRESDRDSLLEMTTRHEGAEAAACLAHWWGHPAANCLVYRQAGIDPTPQGFLFWLSLERLTESEAERDEAVARAKAHLARLAPLRPGETATHIRFWMAGATYHGLSPIQSLILVSCARHYLMTPGLAYSFFPVIDAETWTPAMTYGEFFRADDCDYPIEGRRVSVFAHDWRMQPPPLWLDALGEKELAGYAAQASSPRPMKLALLVLSQEDFSRAVREALKILARGGELLPSPLLRSRVVGDRVRGIDSNSAERAAALKALLQETISGLEGHPRRDRAYRALLHTVLRPAPSQQRASELLDLPFSTYRRHLAEGIDLVVEALWQQEIGNAVK